jgi:hypothetical protein
MVMFTFLLELVSMLCLNVRSGVTGLLVRNVFTYHTERHFLLFKHTEHAQQKGIYIIFIYFFHF